MPQSVVIVPHLKASPVSSPPALQRVHIQRVHRHLPTHHYLLNQVVPVQFSDYWPWQMSSPIPVHQQSRLSRSWGTILISMSNRVRCALMPKLPPCIISTYMLSRTGCMDVSSLPDDAALPDLPSVRYEDVLPNHDDDIALKTNFAVLIGRVLKKHMPFFATYGSGLESHIKHVYYKEMAHEHQLLYMPISVTCMHDTWWVLISDCWLSIG